MTTKFDYNHTRTYELVEMLLKVAVASFRADEDTIKIILQEA